MSDLIYCVKCKQKTNSHNNTSEKAENGRDMKRGTCEVCGTHKTQFIAKDHKGGSTCISNKIINNLPV